MILEEAMRTTSENNTLSIYLDGRIDTGNAAAAERDILGAAEGRSEDIVLDADKLEYISSAGLRVLMKLRKMIKKPLPIINVGNDIYDILETTGFTELLEVKRALRQFSVEGCELIGKGGNGSVYRISEDEIIKVYTPRTSFESIEKERELARSAFIAGVPTAIPYDVVRVGEDYGIVFEMVKADVIARKFMNEPASFDEYADKYARLFKEIHSVSLAGKGLPSTKQIYLEDIARLDGWYEDSELERMKWFIGQIPDSDTMVHGDFHTNNIMIQGEELLIIDMAEISCGDPIFDLASSYFAHMLNPRLDPDSVMKYLNVTPDIAMRLWGRMMRVYFGTEDSEKLKRYDSVIEGFCLLKAALAPAIWVNMPEERKKASVESARKYLFPQMESLLAGLAEMRTAP